MGSAQLPDDYHYQQEDQLKERLSELGVGYNSHELKSTLIANILQKEYKLRVASREVLDGTNDEDCEKRNRRAEIDMLDVERDLTSIASVRFYEETSAPVPNVSRTPNFSTISQIFVSASLDPKKELNDIINDELVVNLTNSCLCSDPKMHSPGEAAARTAVQEVLGHGNAAKNGGAHSDDMPPSV